MNELRDFEDRASLVAEELLAELEPALQKAVLDADWDAPIDLEREEGALYLAYKTEDSANIFNAEYGPEGGTPNAVVRPFLTKSEPVIKQAIEDEALNFLFLKGILP